MNLNLSPTEKIVKCVWQNKATKETTSSSAVSCECAGSRTRTTMQSSQKGKQLMEDEEHHLYRKQKDGSQGTEYWVCVRDKALHCPGRGISRNNRAVFNVSVPHSHAADLVDNELRAFRASLRDAGRQAAAVAAGGAANTGQLYANAVAGLSEEGTVRAAQAASSKRNIANAKRKEAGPQNAFDDNAALDDLVIPANFAITPAPDNQQFVLYDSGTDPQDLGPRFFIIGTGNNMNFLATCNSVAGDGTFRTSPQQFAQVYTIHGSRRLANQADPIQRQTPAVALAYFLLPNKSQPLYVRAFGKLRELVGNGWQPQHVMLDFEAAAVNAVQEIFPQATVAGCFFHFRQCFQRRINDYGLRQLYTEAEGKTMLKYMMALAFVPPAQVRDVFQIVLQEINDWRATLPQAENDGVQHLLAYFEENWLGGVAVPAHVAPIERWNMYQRTLDGLGRTDNESEGFHFKMNQRLGHQPPSFWKLLNILFQLQAETRVLINKIDAGQGAQIRRKRTTYVQVAESILEVVQGFPGPGQAANWLAALRRLGYNFGAV